MSLYMDVEKNVGGFNFKINVNTDSKILGILGPSGSGKSIALKCIAGIITPDKGKIILNGRILFDSEKKINIKTRNRDVGFLFQNYALFPNMNVEQNILSGVKKNINKDKILREMLSLFRLRGIEKLKPNQLSGGQQQRVALARIFAINPEIILLDEPFSALDSNLKEFIQLELITLFKNYNKQVILVSHNRDEVFRFCDDMVLIENGKSIKSGTVKEIFDKVDKVSVAQLIGIKNIYPISKIDNKYINIIPWDIALKVENVDDEVCAIGVRTSEIILSSEEINESIEVELVMAMDGFKENTAVFRPKKAYFNKNISDIKSYIIAKVSKEFTKDKIVKIKYIKFNNIFLLK